MEGVKQLLTWSISSHTLTRRKKVPQQQQADFVIKIGKRLCFGKIKNTMILTFHMGLKLFLLTEIAINSIRTGNTKMMSTKTASIGEELRITIEIKD